MILASFVLLAEYTIAAGRLRMNRVHGAQRRPGGEAALLAAIASICRLNEASGIQSVTVVCRLVAAADVTRLAVALGA